LDEWPRARPNNLRGASLPRYLEWHGQAVKDYFPVFFKAAGSTCFRKRRLAGHIGASNARADIGRDAGEQPERLDRLMHAHPAATHYPIQWPPRAPALLSFESYQKTFLPKL
jgi:hypothetical protein